jgi:hypothetical protein
LHVYTILQKGKHVQASVSKRNEMRIKKKYRSPESRAQRELWEKQPIYRKEQGDKEREWERERDDCRSLNNSKTWSLGFHFLDSTAS